ncbi:NnrS family protein [Primorskyibacter sp. 2E233]|uniref:NnrS family protein n=1 Tax=Primorskyibacter sp. 2E233 TaxID=3413431 RepID=UPI003BF1E189
MTKRAEFHGPALFSYGFRPFFLAAILFGLCVVPIWWLVLQGRVSLTGVFSPTDWHSHEMIYGYGTAVVAGFLFTAVPNWTGRLPTRGWPLAVLLGLWLVGRVAVAGLIGLGPISVALLDQTFLLAVAAMIAREIFAGKNWKNLKVLVPVTLLWVSNLAFHFEAAWQGNADIGKRLGIALLVFLILLIGGRIVPSFTRNWLARRDAAQLPVAFNRFDGATIGVSVTALLAWVLAPVGMVCGGLSLLAAILQVLRLWRWQGVRTWPSPLLLMLHIAYLFIPLGFLGVAAGAHGITTLAMGAHLLGIGAIGGMTIAVMMRATMGHTGRDLKAGGMLILAFTLLVCAALFRGIAEWFPDMSAQSINLAVALWTAAFALLAWRISPWLAGPKTVRCAAPR